MIDLAIAILWLLLGLIVLLGVVWLALYVVKIFVAVPDKLEKVIWVVALILCLIAALSLLVRHGPMGIARWNGP